MAGTKEGARKARQTILEKYGREFYRNAGRKGGSVCNPEKGFASNRELARIAGAKGGRISKRGGAK